MDKYEYLSIANERIQTLVDEESFSLELAQVRSRAMQEDLLPVQPATGFTFDPKQVWAYCDYIFSEGSLLLREGFDNRESTLASLKKAAQAFEFLAKFADEDDKERLLLSSAMCYHIAGYQANAQCIIALVKNDEHLREGSRNASGQQTDSILVAFFKNALIHFLERDIGALWRVTSRAAVSVQDLQGTITRGIAEREIGVSELFDLAGHAFFHQALYHIVQFCLSGDQNALKTGTRYMGKSHEYFRKVGDITLGTLTSELRTVITEFEERSTWTNIREYGRDLVHNPVWQLYLRNLALEQNIVEFWLSQLKAIRAGLLTTDNSYVVQMPTSAGKTLIAELAILAALTRTEEARCLYIAPYRALVNEIKSQLGTRLGVLGFRVSNLIGGFEFDAFQDFLLAESQVLVATPEKVELLLRAHPEFFERLAVVIVDEGQILDEGIPTQAELDEQDKTLVEHLHQEGTLGRGPLLELLITRLKRRLPDARFVFLSAVMPDVNADEFIGWLAGGESESLRISRSERPSRQVIAKFEWMSGANGQLEYVNLPKLPGGRAPFVPYFIQRQQYYTGRNTPGGERQRRSWPTIGNKAQTTAMLAARFAKTGPVLVFCAQTGDVRNVTKNVMTALQYLEASDLLPKAELGYVTEPQLESYQLALEWLGEEHVLTQALHHGVGLHYGPLPDPVRQAVEDEFRANKIHILVSTNTLAQGVNMPIKTAIIYSLERTWADSAGADEPLVRRSKVKKRDFWNVCGRAGRAGRETEGQIIFVRITRQDERLLNEYVEERNIERVDSALFKLLTMLIERRIDQHEVISFLSSHVLTILAEEVVDTDDERAVREFLGMSLTGIQASRRNVDATPLVQAIQQTARWTLQQVPDHNLRKAFASTGLRLSSCLSLEAAADSFLSGLSIATLDEQETSLTLNEALLEAAIYACADLPEMVMRGTRHYDRQNEIAIIRDWVRGATIRNLRTRYVQQGEVEGFSEYISERLTYKLPWGANGFLRILAHKLRREYEELPFSWQHFPSMLKFGVDHVFACWASSLGIASRRMALQIAQRYQHADGDISFSNFANWLINLPMGFVLTELEGSEFDKQRLLTSINDLVLIPHYAEVFRQTEITLESLIQGIAYQSELARALETKVGDDVELERDIGNPYDPNAVTVKRDGSRLGYVKRDIARIVAQEMKLGRQVSAVVNSVSRVAKADDVPQIVITILLR